MARQTQPEHGTAPGIVARNPRIKRLRRLTTQRKARSDERAFVIEGPQIVGEALAPGGLRPGLAIEAIYIEHGYEPALGDATLLDRALAADVDVVTVAAGVLGGILDTRSPRPVAAVVAGNPSDPGDLGGEGHLPVLIDPVDPGNLGTLIRSAEASGAAGVVLAGNAVDPTNPKVVRAAAGAALRLPIVSVPDAEVAFELARAGGWVILATVLDPTAAPYDSLDLTRAALVLGSEAHGLPDALVADADQRVTIPFAGPTESLNLGVAGSILCFESLRQRRSATAESG